MGHYIHTLPGRLRIKNPKLKYNSRNCAAARDFLQCFPGVNEIKTNPSIGSLTIRYDESAIEVGQLLSALQERQLILAADINDKKNSHIETIALKTSAKINKALLSLFVSRTLEANGLSLLAALI